MMYWIILLGAMLVLPVIAALLSRRLRETSSPQVDESHSRTPDDASNVRPQDLVATSTSQPSHPSSRSDFMSSDETPQWASGVFNHAQYTRFIAILREALDDRNVTYRVGDGVVIARTGEEQESVKIGLLNLAQICAAAPGDEWQETIDGFLKSVLDSVDSESHLVERFGDFDEARSYLRVRLMPEDFFDSFDEPEMFIWRKEFESVVSVLVYDLPASVAVVRRREADQWDMDDATLMSLGLENTREELELMPTLARVEDGVEVFAFMDESFFVSTMSLSLEDDYPDCIGPYGALIGVPTRHTLIAHPIRDSGVLRAVSRIIPMILHFEEQGPGSLSRHLYWYHNGRFTTVPFKIEGKRVALMPPKPFVELLQDLDADEL